MAQIRVMAVFQGGSQLPEDRFVNTFHFSDVGPPSPQYVIECRQRVIDFYLNDTQGVSIGNSLSPYVDREAQVQSYDLDEPPGSREPTVQGFTLPAAAGTGLPEEVAICATLEGAPPVNQRRRGRLYIGPLCNSGLVIAGGTATDPSRPQIGGTQDIGRTIVDRCIDLAFYSAFTTTWCIRSVTPSENFVPIVSGYVDDAWDTQRRRGPDPSTRVAWS